MVLFYVENGVLGSRDPEWMQGALIVLIGLLRRYRLLANAAKSKAMTCHPVTLQSGMSEEVVGRR